MTPHPQPYRRQHQEQAHHPQRVEDVTAELFGAGGAAHVGIVVLPGGDQKKFLQPIQTAARIGRELGMGIITFNNLTCPVFLLG